MGRSLAIMKYVKKQPVAMPGASEFRVGLAIDLVLRGGVLRTLKGAGVMRAPKTFAVAHGSVALTVAPSCTISLQAKGSERALAERDQ